MIDADTVLAEADSDTPDEELPFAVEHYLDEDEVTSADGTDAADTVSLNFDGEAEHHHNDVNLVEGSISAAAVADCNQSMYDAIITETETNPEVDNAGKQLNCCIRDYFYVQYRT